MARKKDIKDIEIKRIEIDKQGKSTMKLELEHGKWLKQGKIAFVDHISYQYAKAFFGEYFGEGKGIRLRTFSDTWEIKRVGDNPEKRMIWISSSVFKRFHAGDIIYIQLLDNSTIRIFDEEEKMYIDEGISDILDTIIKIENRYRESGYSAEAIIDSLAGALERETPVNVIPGGIPGVCHGTLVVAVGTSDNDSLFEARLLEAANHVTAHCKGITKNVIFVAVKWNGVLWSRYSKAFSNVGAVLRLFQTSTSRLTEY